MLLNARAMVVKLSGEVSHSCARHERNHKWWSTERGLSKSGALLFGPILFIYQVANTYTHTHTQVDVTGRLSR